jgi:large subunit ribosomal protein L25
MSKIVLKATTREVTGKQVRALRRAGQIPAIIYGHKIDPLPISLDFKDTSRVLPSISTSELVTVEVAGKPHETLVRERQRHPVTGALIHIDFQEVSMTEKLRVTIGIHFVGEAPAVKEFDGVLVIRGEELEAECLPQDLINYVEVDLSVLKTIGSIIHVRDIALPPAIDVLSDPDDIMVIITPPVVEEAEEGEAGEEAEPEVIERGKKEEEEF